LNALFRILALAVIVWGLVFSAANDETGWAVALAVILAVTLPSAVVKIAADIRGARRPSRS
jgi:hypothetical protein